MLKVDMELLRGAKQGGEPCYPEDDELVANAVRAFRENIREILDIRDGERRRRIVRDIAHDMCHEAARMAVSAAGADESLGFVFGTVLPDVADIIDDVGVAAWVGILDSLRRDSRIATNPASVK